MFESEASGLCLLQPVFVHEAPTIVVRISTNLVVAVTISHLHGACCTIHLSP
uniref:Uncharacterized protein n=1 Tax=Cucumis melo TaxID=3656 RepID=A0A9I9EI05_CUCME